MKAVVFDGELRFENRAKPVRKDGEVLIRVVYAGICNTDHEILAGYVPGFNGVPGHEFSGIVEEADNESLIGKRVTAEINYACGRCDFCIKGIERHCSDRTVMGIINQDGAMAEYLLAPEKNVIHLPDSIGDREAVLIEPLAAALEITEQVKVGEDTRVLIFGDGKLGILVSEVLSAVSKDVTVVGRHRAKLDFLSGGINTLLEGEFEDSPFTYDLVVEATGNSSVFEKALLNVKPRGTVVLKSTYSGSFDFNPSLAVVNEINIIGSRCGLFSRALDFIEKYNFDLKRFISAEFNLEDAVAAFDKSAEKESLKVILKI